MTSLARLLLRVLALEAERDDLRSANERLRLSLQSARAELTALPIPHKRTLKPVAPAIPDVDTMTPDELVKWITDHPDQVSAA